MRAPPPAARIAIALCLIVSPACESTDEAITTDRGIAPQRVIAPPRNEGHRLRDVEIPTEPPFVGEAGLDADGFPHALPDQIALLTMLRLGRFDELERFLIHYQAAFEADWHHEEWPDIALAAFHVGDPELATRLDEWVDAKPDSYWAVAARGNHHHRVGWHYRGGRFIAKTPPKRIEAMNEALTLAKRDFGKAISLNPKFVPAHTRLIRIADLTGEMKSEREHLDAALAQCPDCAEPWSSYILALQPRWGGSYEQMAEAVEQANERVEHNPRLARLGGHVAAAQCSDARMAHSREVERRPAPKPMFGASPPLPKPAGPPKSKAYAAALAACTKALEFGEDWSFLVAMAELYFYTEQHDAALPFVERAEAVQSQNRLVLQVAFLVRYAGKDTVTAARSLVLLRHLDPTGDNVRDWVESAVKRLRFEGHNLTKEKKLVEAAAYFAVGLELAPDDHDLMTRQAWNQRDIGFDDSKKLLAKSPDDFALHLQVDHGLALSGRYTEVVQMWDTFIAAHPSDPRAYIERAGAKWHLGEQQAAIADMQHACKLGSQKGCTDAPKMRARVGRPPGRQ